MQDTFDILFDPVRIGPVTAPNCFYQVPHRNGLGYHMPQSLAANAARKGVTRRFRPSPAWICSVIAVSPSLSPWAVRVTS